MRIGSKTSKTPLQWEGIKGWGLFSMKIFHFPSFNEIIAYCFLILCISCNHSFNNLSDYLSYIKTLESGLSKQRFVNGIQLTATYLPTDYLISRERPKSTQETDSLRAIYKNSLTFLLTIGPDEREDRQQDIMFQNISKYEEYAERMLTMNFEIGQYISLKTENGLYQPVLTNMENTYGLKKSRNILLVFAPNDPEDSTNLMNATSYDLVYDDALFDLGINHFAFKREDIDNIPKLNI